MHVAEISKTEAINRGGGLSNEDKIANRTLLDIALREAQEALNRSFVLHDLTEEDGLQINRVIRVGRPHKKVMECIEQENIDLVVMGTKGTLNNGDVLIGSNTEKIVRKAKCPVLAVKHGVEASAFNTFVMATEMNPQEQVVIDQVKQFQQLFDATIHMVWINTRRNFKPDTYSKPLLKEFVKEMGLKNTQTHVYSDDRVEDGIRSFAEYINGGLIAMGTSSNIGLSRLLRGSVAEDIVNHANRPVLTISTRL